MYGAGLLSSKLTADNKQLLAALHTNTSRHVSSHAAFTRIPPHLRITCDVRAASADGSPAKPLWRLHEAVEVMSAAYCGSLAIEYKHLQQQDEMAWMEQRFESRRPLSNSQKRQVSEGADA
jgi:hypothetical protein